MTNKKAPADRQQDKSTVLSLLESIERIYLSCQSVLNTYSQTTLMLSVAIEAQMLLMKLRMMKNRWHCHLPFKEASTVDFYDWGKKVEEMAQGLSGFEEYADKSFSECCPSKHFLLDYYELLPEHIADADHVPYYQELDIPKFLALQEKIRKMLTRQWKTYKARFSDATAGKVDERIGGVLQPLSERGVVIRMTCCEVLQQLSAELFQLYEMSAGVIQRDQFSRLAERVVSESDYEGRKAQDSARRDVANLKNTTPEEEWDEQCAGEIKASIEIINEMKHGRKVFKFLGKNYNIQGRYAGLGRFLNSVRRDIGEQELYDLMEQLYRIQYLREDSEQQKAENTAEPAAAPPAASPSAARPVPQRPKLPAFFSDRLIRHARATERFYDVLHRCAFYMGRPLTPAEKADCHVSHYGRWQWNHVRIALTKLGIIRSNTAKLHFAQFVVQVFPHLKVDNITRGFQRHPEIAPGFDTVAREAMEEFAEVMD